MSRRFFTLVVVGSVLVFLATVESSVAGLPRSYLGGISHPTYASMQAEKDAASSSRTRGRAYRTQTRSYRNRSDQPCAKVTFKVGDQAQITGDEAALMRGQDVIATLPKGQEITILRIDGPWLGTSVDVGGATKSGWVRNSNVAAMVLSPVQHRVPETGGAVSQQATRVPNPTAVH